MSRLQIYALYALMCAGALVLGMCDRASMPKPNPWDTFGNQRIPER